MKPVQEDAQDNRRPQGIKIEGYFGQGRLRPEIGKLVRKTGEPEYCGMMALRVFGYQEGPNSLDQTKISRRYFGEFLGIRYDGTQITAASGFVPSSIDGALKSKIDAGDIPASFAGEVWCLPDENNPKNQIGFRYEIYDRNPRGPADPLVQLAAAAGIITPPSRQIEGPAQGVVDPETGEIH